MEGPRLISLVDSMHILTQQRYRWLKANTPFITFLLFVFKLINSWKPRRIQSVKHIARRQGSWYRKHSHRIPQVPGTTFSQCCIWTTCINQSNNVCASVKYIKRTLHIYIFGAHFSYINVCTIISILINKQSSTWNQVPMKGVTTWARSFALLLKLLLWYINTV